jgi:hypothetical protein
MSNITNKILLNIKKQRAADLRRAMKEKAKKKKRQQLFNRFQRMCSQPTDVEVSPVHVIVKELPSSGNLSGVVIFQYFNKTSEDTLYSMMTVREDNNKGITLTQKYLDECFKTPKETLPPKIKKKCEKNASVHECLKDEYRDVLKTEPKHRLCALVEYLCECRNNSKMISLSKFRRLCGTSTNLHPRYNVVDKGIISGYDRYNFWLKQPLEFENDDGTKVSQDLSDKQFDERKDYSEEYSKKFDKRSWNDDHPTWQWD